MSQGRITLDQQTGNFDRFVSRVVEQLNVELIFRIFKPADRIEQAVDDILLVKDGKLHGNTWQVVRGKMSRGFRSLVFFMLVIKVDHPIAVGSVSSQYGQDDEVRNQQRQVEGIDLIETLKSLVQKMLAKVGAQALRDKNEGHGKRRSERQRHEVRGSMKSQ